LAFSAVFPNFGGYQKTRALYDTYFWYISGYLVLMDRLIESSARSKLLKAIRLLTIFYPAAAHHKNLIKMVTRVWSSAEEETHRVQGKITFF